MNETHFWIISISLVAVIIFFGPFGLRDLSDDLSELISGAPCLLDEAELQCQSKNFTFMDVERGFTQCIDNDGNVKYFKLNNIIYEKCGVKL